MNEFNESRQSFRLPVSSAITCCVEMVDSSYQGVVRNMSVAGLYVELEDELQTSGQCEVEIVLNGKSSRLKIEGLKGNVIRCDDNGAAVSFDTHMEWLALVSTYFSSRS